MLSSYKDLLLYISPEKFYLHPVQNETELFVIDRVSHKIYQELNEGQLLSTEVEVKKYIHGIIGIINLIAGPYLIIITRITKVAELYEQPIYRVDEFDIISFFRSTLHLTDEQVNYNNIYLSMVKLALNTPHMYFSYTYDITHTLQRLSSLPSELANMPYFERCDMRFVWNQHLLKNFASKPELQKYALILLHGFITSHKVTINQKTFNFVLISRRNVNRSGIRLFSRGADMDGNVSNFVETEQIIEYNDQWCSFVQIRGSIPLIWSQMPNLRYKPPPLLSTSHYHVEVFNKHMKALYSNYGKVVIVNLIDQKGPEGIIEKSFRNVAIDTSNIPIRYEAFDFHNECSKLRWYRLCRLMEKLETDIKAIGYFSCRGTFEKLQEGVFRTNCIDCLDRTNVVQSLLAKRSLEDQLKRLSIIAENEDIEMYPDFYFLFRNVWADNADFCSIQYSGSKAQKNDFTRTGKRTHKGVIEDGIRSLFRFYRNNFTDGFRQDAIDLILGKYLINENEGKLLPCPLQPRRDWKYLSLPLIGLGAISMFFFSIFIPSEYTTETLMYLLFWFGMIVGTLFVIIFYGTEFVNFPRLCPVKPIGVTG